MADILTPAELARFSSLYTKGKPDQCWNWTGALSQGGRPKFMHKVDGRTTQGTAARLMYEMHVGSIPASRFVLPKCENVLCVNPAHMFLSSQPRGKPGDAQDVSHESTRKPVRSQPACVAVSPASGVLVATPAPVAALDSPFLSALDSVTSLDVPAIELEIAACETRLTSLRILFQLASLTGRRRAAEQVRAPALPSRGAPAVHTQPKKLRRKPSPSPSQSNKLARRMAYFLASRTTSVTIADLAAAMTAKPASIEHQAKLSWFFRHGDTLELTNAGKAVALEGRS